MSNLLETFDFILDLLDEGAPVDLILFDFKKAFDTVPHKRLVLKLRNMGISGKLLNVLENFWSDRSFRVGVDGKMSTIRKILSGIPQGSVLGPILFLIYINDLPDRIKSRIKLFADDLKLIDNASDRFIIDSELKELKQWEKKWLLEFNMEKCKVMHIDINSNHNFRYWLNSSLLAESNLEKDLGVLTSDTLLWREQIESCISKANKLI